MFATTDDAQHAAYRAGLTGIMVYDWAANFHGARLLDAVVAYEDDREDNGLDPDDRISCHRCREWATAEHLADPRHQSLI